MEEGVTSEASSIAGRQELGNLIVFYDHNEISIEDDTNIALSEDVAVAVRGVRLARAEGRGRGERRRHPGGDRGREGGDGPAVVHPAAHDHRVPGAEPDEHRQGARRGARRRRGRRGEEDPRFRPERLFRGRRRGDQAHPAGAGPRSGREGRVGQGLRRLGGGEPGTQGAVRPDDRAAAAGRLDRRAALLGARPEGHRDPGGVRQGAVRAGSGAAGVVGRVGGPGGVEQHDDGGRGLVRSGGGEDQALGRATVRPHPAFRDPGARDGRDPVRDRDARPDPPVRRHVPAPSPTTCAARCGWPR